MARLRSVESYGNKHSCRVCAFRSRFISKMAVHTHSDDTKVVEHQQCSGASLFSTSYAHAMQFDAEQGQGLFGGAPSSADSESSPRAGSIDELAAHPESPAAAAGVHACAAPLSDIMAQLWETTNPLHLSDLLCSGS